MVLSIQYTVQKKWGWLVYYTCWRDEIPREFTFVNCSVAAAAVGMWLLCNDDVLYYKHQRNCPKWATVLDCCCQQLQLVTVATIVMHSHWLHPLLLGTGCWSWSAMTSQFGVSMELMEVMMVVAVNSHIWSHGDSSLAKGCTRCWLHRVSKRAWQYGGRDSLKLFSVL